TIADQWTSAVSAGVGGALLALAGRLGRAQPDAVGLAMAFVIGLCGLAVLATWRSGPAQAERSGLERGAAQVPGEARGDVGAEGRIVAGHARPPWSAAWTVAAASV